MSRIETRLNARSAEFQANAAAMAALCLITLGNVVAPKYSNGNNLAMRMQRIRREMILELS